MKGWKRIMDNTNTKTANIVAIVLTLLMASSAFLVFSNSKFAAAQTTVSSNLLQYEWTMSAASATRSNFGSGPAPNVPNIEWKTTIPNIYTGPSVGLVAFNGLIFVQTYSAMILPGFALGSNTLALDAGTGNIVWNITASGNMAKLDNTYMLIGSNCYKIADGSLVWTGPPGFSQTQSTQSGVGYIPDLKMLVTGGLAWNLADPSKPPTLAWNRTTLSDYGQYGSESPGVYGDGVVVYSTFLDFIRGVNATNGKTLWTTPASTHFIYGMSSFDGEVIHGGADGNMRAWNITTGQLIWTFNPRTYYNGWSWAPAVAYGMVYEHNEDTYVYAVNATTGKLVWKAKGPGIGYSNYLTVADGKVFVQMGENQYRDPGTGQFGHSEYDAFNAYTGQLVWTVPFENSPPFNIQINAYGNLYVVPSYSVSTPGVFTYPGYVGKSAYEVSYDEVWCIGNTPRDWSMFLGDPAHSAYGYGPTNLALEWKFATGGEIMSSPTFANGVGYIGSNDGSIYAFDAATGTKLWNFTTGSMVFSTVAVVNNKLYTGAESGSIYCLDASTGNKLWATPIPGIPATALAFSVFGTPFSSPIVYDGKIYEGATNGIIYCLDASSGTILWQVPTGGIIYATPTIVDNALYITSSTPEPSGTVLKLNPATGRVLLNATVPYSYKSLGYGDTMLASPTVANGMIFVRTGLYSNFALNANTGAVIWEYDEHVNPGTPSQSGGTISTGAPLYANGMIYINDYYGITALNASSGNATWSTFTLREDLAQGITYSYGVIYTVNEAGILRVLDAASGRSLSYYNFGTQMHSTPTPYNGSLYVASNNWDLYCFGEAVAPTVANTSMTISLSSNTIQKGQSVTVSGSVSGVSSAVPVSVYFAKPDSSPAINITATTDTSGNFKVIYTPDIIGDWTVVASWIGDSAHTASSSQSLTLTVVEPAQTPTPAVKGDIDAAIASLTPLFIGLIVAIAVAICLGIYTIWAVRKLKK
jgi:outer membrane protein assembly factor BamB